MFASSLTGTLSKAVVANPENGRSEDLYVPIPLYCVVCGADQIVTTSDEGGSHVACLNCGAEVMIEFNPPDAPELAGRIQLVTEPRAARSSATLSSPNQTATLPPSASTGAAGGCLPVHALAPGRPVD
jgi:hypothetical protein